MDTLFGERNSSPWGTRHPCSVCKSSSGLSSNSSYEVERHCRSLVEVNQAIL